MQFWHRQIRFQPGQRRSALQCARTHCSIHARREGVRTCLPRSAWPCASVRALSAQTIKDVVAEKIEGMAWGPGLKDGREVLYVFSDNDLFPELPTKIYAFAIDEKAAGIKRRPQTVLFPVFGPFDLLKALFF